MKKVMCGEFVRRQTADSKFSHFTGSFESLEALVEKYFAYRTTGYKAGVILVRVPADGFDTFGDCEEIGMFYSGVIQLDETSELIARFEARRGEEEKYINVTAKGYKIPAEYVEIVLYHRDVIIEDGDTPPDAEWEIVSINARTTALPEPMTPMAMARNMAGMAGGTKASYTAEQFMQSILYWSDKAMAE